MAIKMQKTKTPAAQKNVRKISKSKRLVMTFERLSRPVMRAAIALLLLGLLILTAYQPIASMLHHKTLNTETALITTIARTVDADAVAIRSEQDLSASGPGTVVPAVSNGKKVAVGDVVARVFTSAEQAQRLMDYNALTEEIAYYEDISGISGGTQYANFESYDQQISDDLFGLKRAIDNGKLTDISELVNTMCLDVTKKQIAVGGGFDVQGRLEALRSKKESFGDLDTEAFSVTAEASGYYFDTSDARASDRPFMEIPKLTVGEIDALLQQEIKDDVPGELTRADAAGKIVTQFTWYLVCCVDAADAEILTPGQRIKVTVDGLSTEVMRMNIKAINPDESGRAALILSSSEMNEQVAALGKTHIRLNVEEYTGYAVNKEAVRVQGDKKGVFVQLGNTVRFRTIKILYENDAVAIVDTDAEGDSNYLKLYDEVIKEGTDLSDGQLIS